MVLRDCSLFRGRWVIKWGGGGGGRGFFLGGGGALNFFPSLKKGGIEINLKLSRGVAKFHKIKIP